MPSAPYSANLQRYFLKLSYIGTSYAGWQRQSNALGVQQVIEETLSNLLNHSVTTMGSGRTDAKVHALGQVAHFSARAGLSADFLYHLNMRLPPQIAAHDLWPVSPQLHARYSACARRYTYRLHCTKQPLLQALSHYCPYDINVNMMNEAARLCLIHDDFKAFSRKGDTNAHHYCRLRQAHWHKVGEEYFFSVTANRFLRGMVRIMVGTMIEVGKGRLEPPDIAVILREKTRAKAGPSAPAHGLYLSAVHYPNLPIQCG